MSHTAFRTLSPKLSNPRRRQPLAVPIRHPLAGGTMTKASLGMDDLRSRRPPYPPGRGRRGRCLFVDCHGEAR